MACTRGGTSRSDFSDICALYSPFFHQLTMQSSRFEPGHLRPWPSHSTPCTTPSPRPAAPCLIADVTCRASLVAARLPRVWRSHAHVSPRCYGGGSREVERSQCSETDGLGGCCGVCITERGDGCCATEGGVAQPCPCPGQGAGGVADAIFPCIFGISRRRSFFAPFPSLFFWHFFASVLPSVSFYCGNPWTSLCHMHHFDGGGGGMQMH